MADERTEDQKALDEQRKAEAEALAADPIGGKPPIDIAHERALEEAEPLGYVDPESQKVPDEPKADEAKDAPAPAKKAAAAPAKSAVTRDDAKGSDNG